MSEKTDPRGYTFVWVKRDIPGLGNMWVKNYGSSSGSSKQYTRAKTTAGKIQEITFNKGGYVEKDKHGKEL